VSPVNEAHDDAGDSISSFLGVYPGLPKLPPEFLVFPVFLRNYLVLLRNHLVQFSADLLPAFIWSVVIMAW
jgi:hypothetical protein